MDGAVGVDSANLQDVDFSSQDQLSGWIYTHFMEHFMVEAALNIGS